MDANNTIVAKRVEQTAKKVTRTVAKKSWLE
jgi:hypothetical protein